MHQTCGDLINGILLILSESENIERFIGSIQLDFYRDLRTENLGTTIRAWEIQDPGLITVSEFSVDCGPVRKSLALSSIDLTTISPMEQYL